MRPKTLDIDTAFSLFYQADYEGKYIGRQVIRATTLGAAGGVTTVAVSRSPSRSYHDSFGAVFMKKRMVICWCAVLCFCALGVGQVSASKPSAPGTPSQTEAQNRPEKSSKGKGHSAHLKWKPSSTKNISGYYVYRADGGTSGTYIRLTDKPIRDTEYVDKSVVAGKTYAYQITAVVMAGKTPLESDRTPAQVVTVPKP